MSNSNGSISGDWCRNRATTANGAVAVGSAIVSLTCTWTRPLTEAMGLSTSFDRTGSNVV
jgi:hypothetical protein